jgi:hypothetical protein
LITLLYIINMKKLTLLLSLCALFSCKKEEEPKVYKIVLTAYSEHTPYTVKFGLDDQRDKWFTETVNDKSFYREIEFSPEELTKTSDILLEANAVYVTDSMHCSIECNGVMDESGLRVMNTKISNLSAEIDVPKE